MNLRIFSKLICAIIIIANAISATLSEIESADRNFTIGNKTFLKDGKPFRYVSGSIHYFRSVPEYWDDILAKARFGGLNAITTYVEWASHQPEPQLNPTKFNFDGNLNLFKFLELAQKNDLLVILRPGPFIDAERDFGGFPYFWEVPVRTSNAKFLKYLGYWFDELLPRLKPYLYENGGPIITMQVENEYGGAGCDRDYLLFLKNKIQQHLGKNLVLFSTDNANPDNLRCSQIPGVYQTIDFEPRSNSSILETFLIQRYFSPNGPLVNSEFYPGWFDFWGQPHHTTDLEIVTKSLDFMLFIDANVNFYMYYGGSNFGYRAGAYADSDKNIYSPVTTSYDYDAPLSESGDSTEKYFAIQKVISKYYKNDGFKQVKLRTNRKKMSYGRLNMNPFVNILTDDFLNKISKSSIQSELPLMFDELKIGSGFVLYETRLDFSVPDPALFLAPFMKDRAYIYVENELQGILTWEKQQIYSAPIVIQKGEKLRILIENQGRSVSGYFERRGLGQNVTLNNIVLKNWTIYPIGEINEKIIQNYPKSNSIEEISEYYRSGTFFESSFYIKRGKNLTYPLDTFLRFDGWTKGVAWINGFNLGKYWPAVGPQMTLYLPGPKLKFYPEINNIIILEIERAPKGCNSYFKFNQTDCSIVSVDKPQLNGPSPNTKKNDQKPKLYNYIIQD